MLMRFGLTGLAVLLFAGLNLFAGCGVEVTSEVSGSLPSAKEAATSEEPADEQEGQTDSTEAQQEDATNSNEEKKQKDKPFKVLVAEDALSFEAPGTWKKVKPRSFIVEYEIAVPKSEGEAEDANDGRLTIMGARGSVKQNIERWYGQYKQPDGSDTKDKAKVEEVKVADCDVTMVDITGTLLDRPGGPMAGGEVVERENYRTMAAIIQAGEHGQYFVKLYGPGKTMEANAKAFKKFIKSLKIDSSKKSL